MKLWGWIKCNLTLDTGSPDGGHHGPITRDQYGRFLHCACCGATDTYKDSIPQKPYRRYEE